MEVIEDGTTSQDANRYYRVYLDDKGNIVGEFAKDPNRKELAKEGNFRFELSLQPTTEAGPQQQMMMTAPAGLTLEELAGGCQEWLDALLHANPGISASEDLNGRQIIIPYGETRTTQTVHDKGMPGNESQRVGNKVPTAPLPYIPYPEKVGGFKQWLPVIVGVTITIAAMATMMSMGSAKGVRCAFRMGRQLTMTQLAAVTAMSSASAAAGSSAAQLTAMELYPELLPDGFNWDLVGDSAILGAMMGLSQGTFYNAFGLTETVMGSEALATLLKSMGKAATTYMTNDAYQRAQGTHQGFNMKEMVGVMLSQGVMDSVMEQAGFVNKEGAWLENSINDVVNVLGGGFADAAMEEAFSGNPMNPQKVFALSLGRMAGRQYGYGAKALVSEEESTLLNPFPRTKDYINIEDTLGVPHMGGPSKTIDAPGQLRSTTSLGTQAPLPGVEDYVDVTQTPRNQKRTAARSDIRKREDIFGDGNEVYQTSKKRSARIHKDQSSQNTVESLNMRLRTNNSEAYNYSISYTPFISEYTPGFIPGMNVHNENGFQDGFFLMTEESIRQTGLHFKNTADTFKNYSEALEVLIRQPGGANVLDVQKLGIDTIEILKGQLGNGPAGQYAWSRIPNLDLVMNGIVESSATTKMSANGNPASEVLEQLARRTGAMGHELTGIVSELNTVSTLMKRIDFGSMVAESTGHAWEGDYWEAGRTVAKWTGGAAGAVLGAAMLFPVGTYIGGKTGSIIPVIGTAYGTAAGGFAGGVYGAVKGGITGEEVADNLYVKYNPKNPSAVPMEHIDITHNFTINNRMMPGPTPPSRLFQQNYQW